MDTIKPVDESLICVEELPGFASGSDIKVSMLRLDKIHPIISGNKWYKLQHNIDAAVEAEKKCLLSFGGAYSNHLIATAAAARAHQLSSIGFVRGAENKEQLNPVLQQCRAYGMDLIFLSRDEYTEKESPEFLQNINQEFPEAFVIPEGGANKYGQTGASDIASFIADQFTHIVLSVGTGTTFIGLRHVLPLHQYMLGFAPMKGGSYLKDKISEQLVPRQNSNFDIIDRFHFGGFGKANAELFEFMDFFKMRYTIELDRVYTGKMMLGLQTIIAENYFPKDASILCIHTGGLTGN